MASISLVKMIENAIVTFGWALVLLAWQWRTDQKIDDIIEILFLAAIYLTMAMINQEEPSR